MESAIESSGLIDVYWLCSHWRKLGPVTVSSALMGAFTYIRFPHNSVAQDVFSELVFLFDICRAKIEMGKEKL